MIKITFQKYILFHILFITNIYISFNGYTQFVTISGHVIAQEDDSPLSFATIFVQHGAEGTISNDKGFFKLQIDSIRSDDTLVISYLGYKLYKISLNKPETLPKKFTLTVFSDTLPEIIVTPLSARERFLKAVAKIDNYYLNTPFLLEGYYKEEISENDEPTIFREAILKIYQDRYLDSFPERQIQIIKGYQLDNLEDINFWKAKIEKRKGKSIKKIKRKAKKDTTNVARRIDSVKTNHPALEIFKEGPQVVFKSDDIHFLKKFKPTNKKGKELYSYEIIGNTHYQGRNTAIFELTDLDYKQFKRQFYISNDDEIMLISVSIPDMKLPTFVKAAFYLYGVGLKEIKVDYKIYYRPIEGKWYLAHRNILLQFTVIDKNIFKPNELYRYHLHLQFVATNVKIKDIKPIPLEKRMNLKKPFEKQLGEYDEQFWENYRQ